MAERCVLLDAPVTTDMPAYGLRSAPARMGPTRMTPCTGFVALPPDRPAARCARPFRLVGLAPPPPAAQAPQGQRPLPPLRHPRHRKPAKRQQPNPTPAAAPAGKGGQAIVALVNDEPISAYDVEQRINLLLLTSGSVNERLKAKLQDPGINEKFKQFVLARNPNIRSQEEIKAMQDQFVASMRSRSLSEARPAQRKAALDEIIDERIKIAGRQEAQHPHQRSRRHRLDHRDRQEEQQGREGVRRHAGRHGRQHQHHEGPLPCGYRLARRRPPAVRSPDLDWPAGYRKGRLVGLRWRQMRAR